MTPIEHARATSHMQFEWDTQWSIAEFCLRNGRYPSDRDLVIAIYRCMTCQEMFEMMETQ